MLVRERRRVRIVLAGGTTPLRCYPLLAEMELPWGFIEVLFGDERCVPPLHVDSNYRVASEALLSRVAPASVRRIPAELGPRPAADLYSSVVLEAPLDLVLLGVGPDGHTASLFPGSPALTSVEPVAAVHDAPKAPPQRVSLTLAAINGAHCAVVLATGAEKAEAVRLAYDRAMPAGLVDRALWLVSQDAAAGLPHDDVRRSGRPQTV